MAINVALVDDHAIVREGLKTVITRKDCGINVVAEASNGRELLSILSKQPIDVFVLDISMPQLNGLDLAARIRKKNHKVKIIFLSMHDERSFVEKAFKCGAYGYVLKDNAAEEIVQAITEVNQERYFLSPKISGFLVKGFLHQEVLNKADCRQTLSNREREILQLIAEGNSSKVIARLLKLSLNTIHVHRGNIMRKLNIHKQADLIRYAYKDGLAKL